MRKQPFVLLVVVLAVAATAAAQTDLSSHPGYFPIAELGIIEPGHAEVDINLSGSLLSMVAAATKNDEPDLSETMGQLEGIRVMVGALQSGDVERMGQQIDKAVNTLETRGWQSIVKVRDGGERVHIFVKQAGETIQGMTILALEDGDEAVIVNIVGSIDPAQMGRLLSSLDATDGVDLDEHLR